MLICHLSTGTKSRARGIDDPEEKALARLGITYGALRRLGFSEEKVEECLARIPGLELDDALDWVCQALDTFASDMHTDSSLAVALSQL